MKRLAFIIAASLFLGTPAFAQQEGRDSNRSSDRYPDEYRTFPHWSHQHWRHQYPRGDQQAFPYRDAPRVGEPDPYAPRVGAANPYAPKVGAPDLYAPRAGDPAPQLPEYRGTRRR